MLSLLKLMPLPKNEELARQLLKVLIDADGRFHKELDEAVDVVVDCVGEPTLNGSLRSLKVGGAWCASATSCLRASR